MRHNISLALVAGAIGIGMLVGRSAEAGWRTTQTAMAVTIDDFARTASGGVGAVRNSPDLDQQISCWLDATTAGVTGSCYARNTNWHIRTCTTTNANLIQAIAMASGDSFIKFGWNTSNQCVSLQVSANSALEPKAH